MLCLTRFKAVSLARFAIDLRPLRMIQTVTSANDCAKAARVTALATDMHLGTADLNRYGGRPHRASSINRRLANGTFSANHALEKSRVKNEMVPLQSFTPCQDIHFNSSD